MSNAQIYRVACISMTYNFCRWQGDLSPCTPYFLSFSIRHTMEVRRPSATLSPLICCRQSIHSIHCASDLRQCQGFKWSRAKGNGPGKTKADTGESAAGQVEVAKRRPAVARIAVPAIQSVRSRFRLTDLCFSGIAASLWNYITKRSVIMTNTCECFILAPYEPV